MTTGIHLAAITTCVILLGTQSMLSQTAVHPAGSGTAGDPFQIDSLDNLYWLTQSDSVWSKHFAQTNDIDASSSSGWDGGNGFTPIGNGTTPFTGVYDGNGHIISGLYISRSVSSYVGFIGYASGSGIIIERLGLQGVNITGQFLVGGLVGYANNSGYASNDSISDCFSSGSVAGSAGYAGGLVGDLQGFVLANSYSTASASGYQKVGGLVGDLSSATISACYSTGAVTGTGGGGIGGLGGGDEGGNTVTSCFWDKVTSGQTSSAGGTGDTTAQMKTVPTFISAGWDFKYETANGTNDYWTMDGYTNDGYPYFSWQATGSGTQPSGSGPYYVSSLANLYWISQHPSWWSANFVQTADIDASLDSLWFSGSGFSPIGNSSTKFTGSYNGNGYTISGLYISRGSSDNIGLFGWCTNAALVQNAKLINVRVTGSSYVGGLIGYADNYAEVDNSYSTGAVEGVYAGGGLIGGMLTTIISYSYSSCNVTAAGSGYSYFGGLVGYSGSSSIYDSYARGALIGSPSNAGGLVGRAASTSLTRCYSTGSVSGTSSVGGLVGSAASSTISNCFWDTQTSGKSTSSGGGSGESTTAMQTQSTFTNAGWNFSSTWAIDPVFNGAYPGLLWQSDYPASAPSATTSTSTGVGSSSATVTGSVSPHKGSTTVQFVYGTVSGVYPDTTTASQSPISGWGATTVSAVLTGLAPSTTYYYTVIASSSYGSSQGSEASFTTSGPPTVSAAPDSALSFNSANNQYVSVPDNSSLQLTDNLTFEAWVYPTGSHDMAILDKGNYNYLFEIRPNGNTGLGFYSATWGWIYSAGSVPLNAWSHVAVVFQTGANGVKFYLDGVLLSVHTAPGSLTTNSGEFAIGKQAPGSCDCNFFNGMMDEVRVWGVARTEQQIQSDMNQTLTGTETGLISYWQFHEGSGTRTADPISGNNGTLTHQSGGTGTPSWVLSEAPVGKYGAFDVTGSADSAGQAGSNIVARITSPADSLNFLGLYSYGSPTDSTITGETFPSGIVMRWPVIWGAFEIGTDTADITLNYGGLSGMLNEATLKVLEREAADSPWVDVTANFSQNTSSHTFTENGVSTFSQFAIGAGSDNVLPVEMASFTATSSRLTANLQWKTATEVNTSGFEIQRSAVSNQRSGGSSLSPNPPLPMRNLQWTSVAFVKGHGTSSSPVSYAYVDRGLTTGTYLYRLKQIDNNGTTRYSSTVNLDVGTAPRVFTLSQNYPNPFNPTTTIEFTLEHDGRAVLKVYDILGREVATLLDADRKAGEYQQVVFDGSRYSSGIYFAVLQSGGKQLIKKMLMVK